MQVAESMFKISVQAPSKLIFYVFAFLIFFIILDVSRIGREGETNLFFQPDGNCRNPKRLARGQDPEGLYKYD